MACYQALFEKFKLTTCAIQSIDKMQVMYHIRESSNVFIYSELLNI